METGGQTTSPCSREMDWASNRAAPRLHLHNELHTLAGLQSWGCSIAGSGTNVQRIVPIWFQHSCRSLCHQSFASADPRADSFRVPVLRQCSCRLENTCVQGSFIWNFGEGESNGIKMWLRNVVTVSSRKLRANAVLIKKSSAWICWYNYGQFLLQWELFKI